jgi:hypothetical protein
MDRGSVQRNPIVQKDKSILNKSQDISQSNAKYLVYGMAQLHNIY